MFLELITRLCLPLPCFCIRFREPGEQFPLDVVKWSVDIARAVEVCERRANERPQHVSLHEFETLCRSVTFRPASFRYVDPPDVKTLERERTRAPEDQRQELAKQVAALRRQRKQEWLADVLLQARSANYRAISYMRRRQSVGHVRSSYILSAGREQQAVSDLKDFYASKYAEDREGDNTISLRMVATVLVLLQAGQECRGGRHSL